MSAIHWMADIFVPMINYRLPAWADSQCVTDTGGNGTSFGPLDRFFCAVLVGRALRMYDDCLGEGTSYPRALSAKR